LALAVASLAAEAHSTTILVPDDAPTIQDGISASVSGDTVLVMPGVYSGQGNRAINFVGRSITLISESGPDETVIDCETYNRGFYFVNDEDTTAVVSGFTVLNGKAGFGGGAYCEGGSSPTFSNMVFEDCQGTTYGGGIYCEASSSPILDRVTFVSCSSGRGGGVYCRNHASPVFRDVLFDGNYAAESGGGLHCHWSSSSMLLRVAFVGNEAADEGGGLACGIWCDLTMDDVVFNGNRAHRGGGLYCSDTGRSALTEGRFLGNSATLMGGGMYVTGVDTSCELASCLFAGNSAECTGGGAMITSSAHALLSDAVFQGNSSDYSGGGLRCGNRAVVEIIYSTFAENVSPTGGGLVCDGLGRVVLTECSLVENSGPAVSYTSERQAKLGNVLIAFTVGGVAVSCPNTTPLIECCDLYGNEGGDWVGSIAGFLGQDGNISTDPMLCGGTDPERMFMLQEGSPCSAEGNPACGQIGAWGVGCAATVAERSSWGGIKARYR
jgi:predicted outer membrane repeat protein